MAERRMFAKTIIDSDAFLDMPLSTQALYFHLSMRADDDGFVNNPKKIARLLGCGDDDARLLLAKKFIISFDSGVIVIKHWKIHNYIQKDRYKETNYHEEKGLLSIDKNNGYTLDTDCIQIVDTGKVRDRLELGEDSTDKNAPFSFSLKKETQYENLSAEYKEKLKQEILKLKLTLSYEDFIDSLMAKGYKYKNFLLAYKTWCKKDFNKSSNKQLYINRCINENARTYEAPADPNKPF